VFENAGSVVADASVSMIFGKERAESATILALGHALLVITVLAPQESTECNVGGVMLNSTSVECHIDMAP